MSWDLNQVSLIGRLVRDPELRYTQQGNPVCTFAVANNQGQDNVSFLDIVVWNKQAETANQYLGKGRRVAVSGRINQRRWQDQNGQNRTKIEIIANVVQFLDSMGQGSEGFNNDGFSPPPPDESTSPPPGFGSNQNKGNEQNEKPKQSNNPPNTENNGFGPANDEFPDGDDDIPF